MAEEEDPFGYLITKLCQPISSHILKLQDCPVLFEPASMKPGDENLHLSGTVQSNGSDGDLETHCYENVIAGPKERMDEKSVEEDRVEPCSVGNLDSVPEKSFGGNRDRNEGTSHDCMEENGGISMMHSEGLESVIARLDCEMKRVEGSKELIDCGSDGVIVCKENKVENVLKQNSCGSLPLSISGRDNEVSPNLKGKKRSWRELIDAFEVYFTRDDSLEDVDFLETAKRRGLTFP